MNRTFHLITGVVLSLACGVYACSEAPVGSGGPAADASAARSADASADVARDGATPDTGEGPQDALPDARVLDAGDAGDRADAADAADAADGNGGVSAQRLAAIRQCMDGRWGTAATRDVGAVLDDFDACTTTAEHTGAAGDALYDAVIRGWAEPDPTDNTRYRRVGQTGNRDI